jgi:Na+/H+-dicarboxylate symporter/ABC-type amino acid transport substrate-binding protein
MSLATRILLGLLLGIVCGLFFGEGMAVLAPVGSAFILLLQMTVLPYMLVSLMLGLGSVSAEEAMSLAKRTGGFLVLFWALTLAAVFLMPIAFPDWKSASFFSTHLIEQRSELDFLSLFIPANPFHSLSEMTVPAVVVFSVAIGIALIGIERSRKQSLLETLATVSDALSRVTIFVVGLAPYGVFAIAANAAGTLSLTDAAGLQVYACAYIALALVLTFWVLPALVTTLTPFRYRDVVWFTRDALVTCFATANLFVVLPIIAEKTKALAHRQSEKSEASDALVDMIVPTSFAFPSAGKLLTLSYVLFAGWVSGHAIGLSQYPALLVTGLAAFFGSSMVAVPFLLDAFQMPADLFQLFVISDSIMGGRIGAPLAAMHTIGLVLLSACAIQGQIRVRPLALARYAVISLLLLLGVVGLVRVAFETMGHEYEGYDLFVEMRPRFETVTARALDAPPDPLPMLDPGVSAIDRARGRGTLRVGWVTDRLPFAFRNRQGELVGLDVEMAHQLARELGVALELVKVDRRDLPRLLDAGYLDTVMSGVAVTTDRLEVMSFSASYLDETLAFIVPDHRREEFNSREAVKRHDSLRIAVPAGVPYYVQKLRRYLPQAELVALDSPHQFFRDSAREFDAMLLTAESGSAWCLIYPDFAVAVPQPDRLAVPLAYPVRRGDDAMVEFLNHWIELKHKDQTIERLYEHWILGVAARPSGPRWSVIRNVLGWVD